MRNFFALMLICSNWCPKSETISYFDIRRYYNHRCTLSIDVYRRVTRWFGMSRRRVSDGREEGEAGRERRHPLIECQYDYVCHAASKPRSMVRLVVLFNTRVWRNRLSWANGGCATSMIRSFVNRIVKIYKYVHTYDMHHWYKKMSDCRY